MSRGKKGKVYMVFTHSIESAGYFIGKVLSTFLINSNQVFRNALNKFIWIQDTCSWKTKKLSKYAMQAPYRLVYITHHMNSVYKIFFSGIIITDDSNL